MKNKIINKLFNTLCFLGMLLLIISCEDTEVADTLIDANQPKLTVTSSSGSFILEEEENDQVITLTANLSKATDKQIRVYIFQESGTADANDLSLPATGYINIPAYQTSATGTITIHKDNIVEDSEVAIINIGDSRTTAAEFKPFKLEIKINNFSTDDARMLLEWDGEDDHLCDMDFDVYLHTFDAFAFTGDCPEDLFEPVNPNNLWTTVLADGDYDIMIDLWDSNGFEPDPVIPVPLRLTVGKRGKFEAFLDLEDLYTANSPDSNNDGDGVRLAGSIQVSEGKYTVYDRNGNLVNEE